MGGEEGYGWSPTGAPLDVPREDPMSGHFDNSVNAMSFGLVATAILISLFLIMAIFEKFLRPDSHVFSPSVGRSHGDVEAQIAFSEKLGPPSPNVLAVLSTLLLVSEEFPLNLKVFSAAKGSKVANVHTETAKLPLMTVYSHGVSVLMPGDSIPTFIAHPAPVPCPPERMAWAHHQQFSLPNAASISWNPCSNNPLVARGNQA